jgi:hypothetical protein
VLQDCIAEAAGTRRDLFASGQKDESGKKPFRTGAKGHLETARRSAQLLNYASPSDYCSLARRTEKHRMGWELNRRGREVKLKEEITKALSNKLKRVLGLIVPLNRQEMSTVFVWWSECERRKHGETGWIESPTCRPAGAALH